VAPCNKHHGVAISHVARKLVGIIYAVCARSQSYDPANMRLTRLTPYSLSKGRTNSSKSLSRDALSSIHCRKIAVINHENALWSSRRDDGVCYPVVDYSAACEIVCRTGFLRPVGIFCKKLLVDVHWTQFHVAPSLDFDYATTGAYELIPLRQIEMGWVVRFRSTTDSVLSDVIPDRKLSLAGWDFSAFIRRAIC
jgi:hypothetical protein